MIKGREEGFSTQGGLVVVLLTSRSRAAPPSCAKRPFAVNRGNRMAIARPRSCTGENQKQQAPQHHHRPTGGRRLGRRRRLASDGRHVRVFL